MIVRRYPGGRRYDFQNGQVARSAWKEKLKPLEKLRTARNVEVCLCVCIVFYRRFLITRLVRTLRAQYIYWRSRNGAPHTLS